jgi:DNA-binding XRE family transcriptional regulator
MRSEKTALYHYKESGLDHVCLQGVTVFTCGRGHTLVHIPHIEMLHDAIAYNILRKPPLLTSNEFRFLRKWIGLTMNELAHALGVSRNTIHRCENKGEITRPYDHLLRMLVAKKKEAPCQRQMYLEIAMHELFEKMAKKHLKPATITIDVGKLPQHPSQSQEPQSQYTGV